MKMKLQIPFQTLSLLMIVLMFNMPSVTLAQQNLVQAEAITTAEQDAINDVNKRLWFVAGLAALGVGGPVGCLAGGAVGSIIQPPPPSDFFYFQSSGAQDVGALVGCAAGVLGPLLWIRAYEPNLPPNRFIGKSPEYIDLYTDAYKKKAKSIRTKSAVGGGVGCIVGGIGGLLLLFSLLSS